MGLGGGVPPSLIQGEPRESDTSHTYGSTPSTVQVFAFALAKSDTDSEDSISSWDCAGRVCALSRIFCASFALKIHHVPPRGEDCSAKELRRPVQG